MRTLTARDPLDVLSLGVFAGMGICMSLVAEWYHRAHQQATDSAKGLAAQTQQLRALTFELTRAEQRERERIAAVLHQDLQQILAGAKLALHPVEQATDPMVRTSGQRATALLQQALLCTRSLAHELAPPILHTKELVPVLEWLGSWIEDHHGLHIKLAASGTLPPTSEDLRILLFQLVQEVLFNVVKHAQVTVASIAVSHRDGHVQIVVADDGVGFEPGQMASWDGNGHGFGLLSIRERLHFVGGSLEIDSAPGKGARIMLLVPLGAPVADLDIPRDVDGHEDLVEELPPRLPDQRARCLKLSRRFGEQGSSMGDPRPKHPVEERYSGLG